VWLDAAVLNALTFLGLLSSLLHCAYKLCDLQPLTLSTTFGACRLSARSLALPAGR
jgi:hypothetical protein